VLTIMAIFMPIALIWVATAAARSSRVMHEESERLQAAINAMRHSYIEQQQAGVVAMKPAVEQKLEQIAAAQRKTDAALATFTSIRPGAQDNAALQAVPGGPDLPAAAEQASLALGTPVESLGPPLSVGDFIRALHFPENADDKEGFRALRRALQDRNAAQLVQSAQDVLTLLSQDGIYMDDLTPDRARPEIWRRFARGERGHEMAVLGGIRDRSSLALAAGRMRQDTIFRDSVHHFLRKFDHALSAFEQTATDQDIAELTDTRTARAFMLLGRASGTFD
jgi:D-alanyl-D-alanine dipeptidase